MHPRVAVLIDVAFFIQQYRINGGRGADDPTSVATAMHQGALRTQGSNRAPGRTQEDRHDLYRAFCYDAHPLRGNDYNPVSGDPVSFSDSAAACFRRELHDELRRKRKVALRLGQLGPSKPQWILRPEATRDLIEGHRDADALTGEDVTLDARQHGVELRMGLDVASLAYKRLVDRIVLVTGDFDFVPAAKLARREGIDVVLDPMGVPVAQEAAEHVDGVQGYMLAFGSRGNHRYHDEDEDED